MSLPEQLQKQVDEANSIIEKHYGTGAEGGQSQESETGSAEGDAPPATAESVESTPPQTAANEDENSPTYAQRWRSLQGIVASQKNQLDVANQRIASMEQVIAMMQVPATAPQQVTEAPTFITDKDREEYGADMVDFAVRAAKQETAEVRAELNKANQMIQQLGQQLNQLQGQVVPTVQRVAQNQQRTAKQEFFAALGQRIPNWEAINADQRFHNWLLTPDPMTGIQPQTYLENAQQSLDVDRTTAIFNTYLSATGAPPQAQSRTAPTSELEQQIAPGRSLTAPAPSANEARKWTRAEVKKLYDDKLRGLFKGREAEFATLEKDFFAAQREGRIAA